MIEKTSIGRSPYTKLIILDRIFKPVSIIFLGLLLLTNQRMLGQCDNVIIDFVQTQDVDYKATQTIRFTDGFSSNSKNITGIIDALAQPIPTLSGANTVCVSTNETYVTEAGMSNYNWTIVGGVITGGGSSADNSVSVLWTSSGSVSVNYESYAGCAAATATQLNVSAQSVTQFTVSGGGQFCAGGIGVEIYLSGSELGVDYQLYSAGIPLGDPIGVPVSGTGTSLTFSDQTTAGVYTVIGTNPTTGCSETMLGDASISVGVLPIAFDVTGGGSYCTGDNGAPVGLSGSESGIDYQLYLEGSPVGASVPGTDGPLTFTNQTAAGVYTVIGTERTTTCTANMAGNVVVIPPQELNVTVPSSACEGDLVNIIASGSGSYTWSPAEYFSCQGCSNVTLQLEPTETYMVEGEMDENGCVPSYSFDITVNSVPDITPKNTYTICSGEYVTIEVLVDGGIQAYTWSPSSTLSASDVVAPDASPLISTTYTVEVLTDEGCTASGEVPVVVKSAPSAFSIADRSIKKGETSYVSVPSSGETYSWSPNNGIIRNYGYSAILSPDQTTNYTVSVSNGICTTEGAFSINVEEEPDARFFYTYPGTSVTFTAYQQNMENSYLWTVDGIVVGTSSYIHTQTLSEGTHRVCLKVTSANGVNETYCEEVIVKIDDSCCN